MDIVLSDFSRVKVWVTLIPILKVIFFYVGYFLNQWIDFLPSYIDIPLGQASELIKFIDLDLIFKVTGGLKICENFTKIDIS